MKLTSKQIRYLFLTLCLVVVGYPLLVWYGNAKFEAESRVLFEIFPAFGILAFTIMWLHIVGGAFRSKLEKHLNFQRFVDVSSVVVLLSFIAHPLLMFVAFALNGGGNAFDYTSGGEEYLIWLAVIAWLVFIGYDILKKFKNRPLLAKHWQTIKFISTIAFFAVLIHSLGLGGDLRDGNLRTLWIFYGLSAGVATFYSYFYQPLKERKK